MRSAIDQVTICFHQVASLLILHGEEFLPLMIVCRVTFQTLLEKSDEPFRLELNIYLQECEYYINLFE